MKKILVPVLILSLFAVVPARAQRCGLTGRLAEAVAYGEPLANQFAQSFSLMDYVLQLSQNKIMRDDFVQAVLNKAQSKGVSLACADNTSNLLEFKSQDDSFIITRTLWLTPQEGSILITARYVKNGTVLNNDPWLGESIDATVMQSGDFEEHVRMAADLMKEGVSVPGNLSLHLKENMRDDANKKIFRDIISRSGLELQDEEGVVTVSNHHLSYSIFYGNTPWETYEIVSE